MAKTNPPIKPTTLPGIPVKGTHMQEFYDVKTRKKLMLVVQAKSKDGERTRTAYGTTEDGRLLHRWISAERWKELT